MTFREKLVELGACASAREWVGDRTLEQAWAECVEPEWLIWLARKTGEGGSWGALACEAARAVLHLIPEGEGRPRLAVEAAERCLADPSEANYAAAANAAANAAAYATNAAAYAAAYAADAANAAASAAAYAAATNITYAADAADAANAAAYAAARAANKTKICRIVRRHVNVEGIRTRLELR